LDYDRLSDCQHLAKLDCPDPARPNRRLLMAPLHRLRRKPGRVVSPTPRARPGVETLEDRTLLNNRFVVPVAVVPDSVTTFATLKAALTTPGLAAGDTVQIQTGSSPGSIVNADLPTLTNLTI